MKNNKILKENNSGRDNKKPERKDQRKDLRHETEKIRSEFKKRQPMPDQDHEPAGLSSDKRM